MEAGQGPQDKDKWDNVYILLLHKQKKYRFCNITVLTVAGTKFYLIIVLEREVGIIMSW